MSVCRYDARFINRRNMHIPSEKDEEVIKLLKKRKLPLLAQQDLENLILYIELKAGSIDEWALCPQCLEPAETIRIIPFGPNPPLMWAICNKCYEKREELEKEISPMRSVLPL
jgi:hypothetical protein